MRSTQICAGPGEPGLVSVVIPTWNRAYSIGQAIESVLGQTYRQVEIIIVDDGSTDNTSYVVAAYGDRVVYIQQPNAGCPAARNTGLGVARGEFIALLDSDDMWYPWKLELQIAFLRQYPHVGMVWTDMTAIRDDGSRIADTYLRTFYKAYDNVRVEDMMQQAGTIGALGVTVPESLRDRPFWVGDIFSQMIRGSLVHTPTTVMRRDRVRLTGGYDESLKPAGEDFDFHLRTTAHGEVGFLDVSAIDYRLGNDDQITAPKNMLAFARNYLKTVQYWLHREPQRITLTPDEIRSILAWAHEWAGTQELAAGNHDAARRHLWQCLRRSTPRVKLIALLMLTVLPPSAVGFAKQTRRRLRRAS